MRQLAAALLLSVLAMGATACESAPGGAAGPAPASPAATAGAVKPDGKVGARSAGWVGDAADLGGKAFGEHLRISVLGHVDPAISVRAANRPGSGMRRIGVEVSVVNVGGKAFAAGIRKSWVVDEKGRRYPAVRAGDITTGTPLVVTTLAVGEQAQGWLVYEVPQNARIAEVRCTVGNTTLAWQFQVPPSR